MANMMKTTAMNRDRHEYDGAHFGGGKSIAAERR
jgi:hypothetical protein